MAFNTRIQQQNLGQLTGLINQADPFSVMGKTMTNLDNLIENRIAKEYVGNLQSETYNNADSFNQAFSNANPQARNMMLNNLKGLAAVKELQTQPEIKEKETWGNPYMLNGKMVQNSSLGKIKTIGGNGTTVNLSTGETPKQQMENFNEYKKNTESSFNRLENTKSIVNALKGYEGGPWDNVKSAIGKYLPGSEWSKMSSKDELASSIRTELGTKMRPAGSGAMSDAELNMYLDAIPSLMTTENGRNLMLKYVERMHDYNVAKENAYAKLASQGNNFITTEMINNEVNKTMGKFFEEEDLNKINNIQKGVNETTSVVETAPAIDTTNLFR